MFASTKRVNAVRPLSTDAYSLPSGRTTTRQRQAYDTQRSDRRYSSAPCKREKGAASAESAVCHRQRQGIDAATATARTRSSLLMGGSHGVTSTTVWHAMLATVVFFEHNDAKTRASLLMHTRREFEKRAVPLHRTAQARHGGCQRHQCLGPPRMDPFCFVPEIERGCA